MNRIAGPLTPLVWAACCCHLVGAADPERTYQVGVAKVDVTPDYPIRLNGFGFRREESEGVTQRIWAKALVIQDDRQQPAVLITLDNLGVRMDMVDEVAARLKKKAGIERSRLALTFTHTHTAPKVNGASDNIFSTPIPPDHQEHIDRYTRELTDHIEQAALAALADRRPAQLDWAVGRVEFAKNRRTAGGPVDHSLPMLVARGEDGQVRAIYVSYACHAVTLSNNKISGDWAGYAQELIERKFPGSVAMVSIGAGSDANPIPGVQGDKVDVALSQGAEIADEAARLISGQLRPLQGRLTTTLRSIDLPLDPPPTREALQQLVAQGGPAGYNAQTQLARLDRGEELLTHLDYPVQTWSFGDRLTMVFLAGEVCVDYALRLRQAVDQDRLWVTAYSNDFCSYIPSERLLKEGGYGGGSEIPYFALPNTLAAGLEQRIIDETKRQIPTSFHIRPGTQGVAPKTPAESLRTLKTHPDLQIELVAVEPLVDDPVAIDFGPDGRLWVAEMPDYTRGVDEEFKHHGRIKVLTDIDDDGVFDMGSVFVDGLRFPTDVKVWGGGVLICDAPRILLAEDTDGDGQADRQQELYSGFATHNPHARVNSLRLGLDNWLYGSGGLFGGQITTPSGQTVDVTGMDFRIHIGRGLIEPATGRTQQGRVRDDWGNWFGCSNSTLMLHYPLDDRWLRRNPHVAPPPAGVLVPDYPDSSRLYPAGELVRFKLSGPAGRPTSVCGLGIYRDRLLGEEYAGNAFVCEPVNQLVHRLVLTRRGTKISGQRAESEQQSEFLTSTDRWFRPVQVRTGPDGALWIVDMYRYVIEHPRWIPPETRAELDTFAGQGRGRIYRVFPQGAKLHPPLRLDRLSSQQLARAIDHPNGTRRDLIQQLLVKHQAEGAIKPLGEVARQSQRPAARLQALATLDGLQAADETLLLHALRDSHPAIRRHGIRLAEERLNESLALREALWELAEREEAPEVLLQLAGSLGATTDPKGVAVLSRLLAESNDPYLTAAALSSTHAGNFRELLGRAEQTPPATRQRLLEALFPIGARLGDEAIVSGMLGSVLAADWADDKWQFDALGDILRAASVEDVLKRLPAESQQRHRALLDDARRSAMDPSADTSTRLSAISLLGVSRSDAADSTLRNLLSPQHSLQIQQAAVDALRDSGRRAAADMLLAHWPSASPAVRDRILDALLSRDRWTGLLLEAIEAGTVRPADLSASWQSRLLARLDERQGARAAQLLRASGASDRQAALEKFQSALQLSGDAERGAPVFARACANCHQLFGKGQVAGPDLAALSDRSPRALLVAILDPSRDVESRYLNYLAALDDGRVFSGMLDEETSTSITLVENGEKRHVLLRNELARLRSTGKSLMPEGLEKDIAAADGPSDATSGGSEPTPGSVAQHLADLMAYVASAGPRPKQLAGNRPALIEASGPQIALPASAAEIYGGDIVFEQPLQNIGMWHGEQDRVGWRLRIDEHRRCDVYIEWSCDHTSAGNNFRLDVAGATLRGAVQGTGGWDKYQLAKVGSVTLPAGEHCLTVRPDGPMRRPALFDLRCVYLVPPGESPTQ